MLTQLPKHLGTSLASLTSLDLSMCKALTAIPETIGHATTLQTLFMGNCYNVAEVRRPADGRVPKLCPNCAARATAAVRTSADGRARTRRRCHC
jgi:hypothetical protein